MHWIAVSDVIIGVTMKFSGKIRWYIFPMFRFQCKCCGYYTIVDSAECNDFICPVCFWQDDYAQNANPELAGGANLYSLKRSIWNYRSFGAVEERFIPFVRSPNQDEMTQPWKAESRFTPVEGSDKNNLLSMCSLAYSAIGYSFGDMSHYFFGRMHPYYPPFCASVAADPSATPELNISQGILPIVGKMKTDKFSRTIRVWIHERRLNGVECAWRGDKIPDRWPFADELIWREIQDEDLNPYDL
jgi:hypothetical protein